jgi:hypothetical protein
MSDFFAMNSYFWLSLFGAFVVLLVFLLAWGFLCSLGGGFDSPPKTWPLLPLAVFTLLVTPATTLILARLQVFPPGPPQDDTPASKRARSKPR